MDTRSLQVWLFSYYEKPKEKQAQELLKLKDHSMKGRKINKNGLKVETRRTKVNV